jgi:phosphatidylglycerophosphatase GEP4
MASSNTQFFLKQSLNVPALKQLSSIFWNPSLAVPVLELNSVEDLNLDLLKRNGVKCIVFDKDNTLSITYVDELHPSLAKKMAEIRAAFPRAVAILSNSVGTNNDVNFSGAIKTEQNMGIPVIRHANKKPGCLDEVMQHFRTCADPTIRPEQICVIGDRLLTDVVFANKFNMLSILVKPLSAIRDHPISTVLRFIERTFILPLVKLFAGKSNRTYVT